MDKIFDAVKIQQEVREELGKKYLSDPESFIRELAKKYEELRKRADRTAVGSSLNSE